MPNSIAILTNEHCSEILGTHYYLALLAEIWKQQGIQVHVTAGCNYIPADLAILHVDSTVVGDDYLELAARYPVAINGSVKDISKSTFSRQLLNRDDPYRGQVIVKTDANYGGLLEYETGVNSGETIFVPEEFERPWRKRDHLDSYNYPVFEAIKSVPQGVWKNKKLIVEKFLPERLQNGDFKHRCYLFFGNQELGMWFAAPQAVFKGATSTSRGLTDQIPESLREMRKASGFGYGRFDYSLVDGKVILFDMNKTPALGERSLSVVSREMTLAFARAISDFE